MKKSQIPWERKSIWRFLGFVPKNQKMRLITKWNNRMNKFYKKYSKTKEYVQQVEYLNELYEKLKKE
jgi:N-dimethylarginine dimethylaminohydrolase